jgi:hypothetical protein
MSSGAPGKGFCGFAFVGGLERAYSLLEEPFGFWFHFDGISIYDAAIRSSKSCPIRRKTGN